MIAKMRAALKQPSLHFSEVGRERVAMMPWSDLENIIQALCLDQVLSVEPYESWASMRLTYANANGLRMETRSMNI